MEIEKKELELLTDILEQFIERNLGEFRPNEFLYFKNNKTSKSQLIKLQKEYLDKLKNEN